MATNAISSNLNSALISQLSMSTKSHLTSPKDPDEPGDDHARVSKMGEFMKQLETLRTTDPAQFKEVTAAIGNSLSELAKSQSSDAAAMLSDLANKFTQASNTGEISALKPSGPPPNNGAPRGAHAYAKQSDASAKSMAAMISKIDSIVSSALTGASSSG